ncbi:hypothetical protein Btru_055367 [Bulinus truncatus]|nr:hypothetical protein Btru_055367 [Bulinus truncatus]
MQEQHTKMVKSLQEKSGLSLQLVSNLVVYAKLLPKSETPNEIDELVFTSQMLKQFSFTSTSMLSLMFGVIRHTKTSATVEEFCKLLIMFLSPHLDIKINYVFKVYDLNQDEEINFTEPYYHLKPCVILPENEEVDAEEAVRELIEIVLKVTDINENGSIDIEEFRRLVKSNVLYLQLLGPCLPNEHSLEEFRQKLENNTEEEIQKIFAHERHFEMEKSDHYKFYPIKLDLL